MKVDLPHPDPVVPRDHQFDIDLHDDQPRRAGVEPLQIEIDHDALSRPIGLVVIPDLPPRGKYGR